MVEYCINCEKQTTFTKKNRFYLTIKGLIKNSYYECRECLVEKDIKNTASDLTFAESINNLIEE